MDGRVAEHFSGIGFKRLTAVECIQMGVSNQHEIGSSAKMRRFLGTERRTFGCRYLYLDDDLTETGELIEHTSWITYYDSREFDPTRTAEWRLAYPARNPVMDDARAADYCWLLQLASDPVQLIVVVAEHSSVIARQLDRLLGTSMRHQSEPSTSGVLALGDIANARDDELTPEDVELLGLLGVPFDVEFGNELDRVVERFGGLKTMPKVEDFCTFVRQICPTTDDSTPIDAALHQWFVLTTEMFFGLERHIVGPVLDERFANRDRIDIDLFFTTAMKYQQSRYSRAGHSWEFHLAAAFRREGVLFTHNRRRLADGTKPDFLFPSRKLFADPATPRDLLTFVGAKTTTKERWQQLAAEGHTVKERYLATMDRDLNHEVLAAMAVHKVIPVIPSTFVAEHYVTAPTGVLSFSQLIDIVRTREAQLALGGLIAP